MSELTDFDKKAIAYSSDGAALKELYRILVTAEKPLQFNCSPVDIIEEMRLRNAAFIQRAKADLEEIFHANGVDLKSI